MVKPTSQQPRAAPLNQSPLSEEHISMYMNRLIMSRYSSMAAMM